MALVLVFSGPVVRESEPGMQLCLTERGWALPVAVSSEEVVEKLRCPLQITTQPQCSTAGLSFHVYEKLHLCIQCVWKEGSVLL